MDNMVNYSERAVKFWWMSIIVGMLSIALGFWAIMTPIQAMVTLTLAFAITFLLNGFIEIAFALSNRGNIKNWGWHIVIGIIDILFAMIILSKSPVFGALLIIYLVAFWLFFQSIWSIGMSIDLLNHKVPGAGWVLTSAIIGLVMSVILLFNPILTGKVVVIMFSFGLVFYGISRITMGMKLRSMKSA